MIRRSPRCLTPLIAALLLSIPASRAAAAGASGSTATIVLVRHAEKDSSTMSRDVPLSAAGQRRADTLAGMLREAGVWRCYATPWQRTMNTAAPLARAIGDSVRVVPTTAEQVKRLQHEAWGHTVLVVGHSNTVPEMVGMLAGKPARAMTEDEYDLMYVVTLHKKGGADVVLLHYGEAGR